jgi:proteasome lid subunit RPN8/RPN11
VEWPAGNDFRMARWSGPRPRGVVAIAHTHPRAFPAPSDADIDQAKRAGMSIFVLTPTSIRVIHADGRTERLADSAEWIESYDGR